MFPPKAGPHTPSRAVRAFFLLLLIPFFAIFPYLHSLNNPNENVRAYMTIAVVEHGTFRIDKVVERHGYVNDMARAVDPKTGEAHLYSIKAPAASLLGVPPYFVFTKVAPLFKRPVPTVHSSYAYKQWWFTASVAVMRFFGTQLPCFLFLVFFERWLRLVSRDTALRLITVAAVGVGTNYLAYSLMYSSHTLFGAAAFTSFALITRERILFRRAVERRKGMALLAGLFAGFATLLEYQAFPVSCALAIYAFIVFYRPARLAMFLAGASAMAGALMFYQWRCYANPLTPGHRMAENPQFAAWHQSGFFGLTTPSWDVFRDLLFSSTYGLFAMSPFLLIGLLAIVFGLFIVRGVTRKQRSTLRLATAIWMFAMLALFVPISAAVNWRGGWTLGPRFYGAAPAFFGFGALTAMEMISGSSAIRRAMARGVAGGLTLAGLVQIGLVALVYNSYPEDVTRPLVQMALPLARAGFVPHHIGELVGLNGVTFWYVAVGAFALGMAAFVLRPAGDTWRTYLPRFILVVSFCSAGLYTAFTKPLPQEPDGSAARAFFARSWEPTGRDLVDRLRVEAERHGTRGPCLWQRLARAEKSVGLDYEATLHAKKGGDAPCAIPWWSP